MTEGTHVEAEDHAWTRDVPDHPARTDSPEYRHSHDRMVELAAAMDWQPFGPAPWQDHHGGGLWFYEGDDPEHGKPRLVRNVVGMEWSAQFGASPAVVDEVRRNAWHFYTGFPKSADALGLRELLDAPITDAAGVARWVDSLCNASVPLPAGSHTGVLEGKVSAAGVHHYPAPVQEIPYFAQPGLRVFVQDEQGHPLAVVPTAPKGSGEGSVEVLWAHPNSAHHDVMHAKHAAGERHILSADHPAAQQAFAQQAAAGDANA